MLQKERVMVFAALLAFSAMIACGGEAGQQETAAGEMAAEVTETAEEMASEATEMAGHEMAEQQGEMKMPAGVTAEMVKQGREVYAGAGLCYVCHGAEGKGMPGLGANLVDKEWLHSDGSFDGITKSVMNGVESSKSSTGTAMPAKGGSGITDEQVKAVSAYVYSLSHGAM